MKRVAYCYCTRRKRDPFSSDGEREEACLHRVEIDEAVVGASVGDGFLGYWTEQGNLWMAGDAECGQTGQASWTPLHKPLRVMLDKDVMSCSTGMRFTIVQFVGGDALTMGGNDYCQLGRPKDQGVAEQVLVSVEGEPNTFAQVTGHKGINAAYLPDQVRIQGGVTQVNCGLHCGFVVTKGGFVFGCGHKGHGLTEPSPAVSEETDYWTFTEQLTQIPGVENAVKVAAEYSAVFALRRDGRVFEWGKKSGGGGGWGFGAPSSQAAKFIPPTLKENLSGVIDITNFGDTCLALCRDQNTGATLVWKFRLGEPAKQVEGSLGISQICYHLALCNGVVLTLGQEGYIKDPHLVAPAGTRAVLVAAGRCGPAVIVVEDDE